MGTVTKNMKIFLVAAVLCLTILAQAWGAPGQHYLVETEDDGVTWKTILFCLKFELVAFPRKDGITQLPTVMHPTDPISTLASGIIHGKDLMADSMRYFVHLCYHNF